MRISALLLLVVVLCSRGDVARSEEAKAKLIGQVVFQPTESEAKVPERFRQTAHTFDFQQVETLRVGDSYSVNEVTFASPVVTEHKANNTVHCEYFAPITATGASDANGGAGKKVPGVIVLHILGGDFPLARMFCMQFASRGVAALFVKMPYYGPRRAADNPTRMISSDPEETVRGMTQAVLDVRRATAWLGAQTEVDNARLGVFGISLGGITASLTATAEPRLVKICPVLAGGDIASVAWDSPELAKYRKRWEDKGFDRQSLTKLMSQIDPVTYANRVQGKKILMINASRDEVIPRRCTESLWEAFGKPPIVWFEGGHYSAALHILDCLRLAGDFFVSE